MISFLKKKSIDLISKSTIEWKCIQTPNTQLIPYSFKVMHITIANSLSIFPDLSFLVWLFMFVSLSHSCLIIQKVYNWIEKQLVSWNMKHENEHHGRKKNNTQKFLVKEIVHLIRFITHTVWLWKHRNQHDSLSLCTFVYSKWKYVVLFMYLCAYMNLPTEWKLSLQNELG